MKQPPLIFALVLSLSAYAAGAENDSSAIQPRFRAVPYPAVGYAPETGWIFGSYTQFVFIASGSSRPSPTSVTLVYSEKHQMAAEIKPELNLDQWCVYGLVKYLRWPDFFWGIGPGTPESNRERFSQRVIAGEITARRIFADNWFGGAYAKAEHVTLSDLEAGRQLDTADVPGADGGATVGLGPTFAFDNRDHIFAPQRGHYHQLHAVFYGRAFGSSFTYSHLYLDLRSYFPLRGSHTIAVQGLGSFVDGCPHFRHLPKVGGSVHLRGYYEGRYRDQHLLMTQVEYRFPLWWRLRGAAFAGIGEVGSTLDQLSPRTLKPSAGVGGRFVIFRKERIAVRLDAAWGDNSSGIYLDVGETF